MIFLLTLHCTYVYVGQRDNGSRHSSCMRLSYILTIDDPTAGHSNVLAYIVIPVTELANFSNVYKIYL